MRNSVLILALMAFLTRSYAAENSQPLNMTCQDFGWSDIETLAAPYLDDVLFTALVMQGQSSNYNVSSAASQAMDDSMPDVVKRILQSIIDADC